MIIVENTDIRAELSLTESDIESAVRQFICICCPEFNNEAFNPEIKLAGNPTITVIINKTKS